ncbi:hypothetical protein SAMN05216565_12913, partial [Litchfieldia salsa]
DEPAGRLLFNLLDGLAYDPEPMAPGARQKKSASALVSLDMHKANHAGNLGF